MKGTYVFFILILLALGKWVLIPFFTGLDKDTRIMLVSSFVVIQLATTIIAIIDYKHYKDLRKSDSFFLTIFSIPVWVVYFLHHVWHFKGKQLWLKFSKFLDKHLTI